MLISNCLKGFNNRSALLCAAGQIHTGQSRMAWESRRDQKAIEIHNKLLKQPLRETSYTASEIRSMKKIFANIREFRKRSEEGFEPSKLFLVWRIANLVGRPYWEKYLIIDLGLHKDFGDYAIVKNTPAMNKKLWTIKHLIRIAPITFPHGLPDEDCVGSTILTPEGELIISPKLKVDPKLLEEDVEANQLKLDPTTLKEHMRLKWDAWYPKLY